MKSFELKFSFNADKNGLGTLNWKIFWISMIVGFLTALAQSLLMHIPINNKILVLSPVSRKTPEVFHSLIPKLALKSNNYVLYKKANLIKKTYSADSYDQAASYLVVDYDSGEVLLGKNQSDKKAIASLTKIMTAMVSLDLAKTSEVFTASYQTANIQPTKIGLAAGQKMTLEELLHALLMTSANDAADVIQEGIDLKYGQPVFIKAMNEKAKLIGLKNTHFDNAAGFDGNGNFSSAEDLAVISHYAMENYPLISSIVKMDYVMLPQNENHRQFDLYNWNGLLGVYPNVIGLKIGNTDQAGKTMVVVSNRNGKKIMAVLLGAPTVMERDLWTAQLMDFGYQNSLGLEYVNITPEQLQEKYNTWKYWN